MKEHKVNVESEFSLSIYKPELRVKEYTQM
jgi:hypothetical protein